MPTVLARRGDSKWRGVHSNGQGGEGSHPHRVEVFIAFIYLFIHSGYLFSTSSSPLEELPTQHGYCVRVSRQRATGSCE